MSDLRFHISGARFRSFPAGFPALRVKEAASFLACFLAVSSGSVRFLFPAYRRETHLQSRLFAHWN